MTDGAIDPVFSTERLIVRPLTLDDAEACFVVYGDPEVTRYVTPGGEVVPDMELMRALLTDGMLAPRLDPRFGFWGLEQRTDATIIGTVALIPIEDDGGVEMGWQLARAHWGKGYALESGVGLLRYGFEQLAIPEILALAYPGNERSIRACLRLGLTPFGRRLHQGAEHECFAAMRDTWSIPA